MVSSISAQCNDQGSALSHAAGVHATTPDLHASAEVKVRNFCVPTLDLDDLPGNPDFDSRVQNGSEDTEGSSPILPSKLDFKDPRTKLLMNLRTSGRLSGDEERKRKMKDAMDYPDASALASYAKTNEHFRKVLASPATTASTSVFGSPALLPSSPDFALNNSPVLGPSKDPTAPHSPNLLAAAEEDTLEDAIAMNRPNLFHRSISEDLVPSNLVRDTSDARMDQERADMLWKLVSNGSPRLKPLGTAECETDGSAKTGVYILSSPLACSQRSSKAADLDAAPFDLGDAAADGAHAPFQSIFKPSDQEKFERRGIEIGLGALREEAAYIIDSACGGQANVPLTTRMSIHSGCGIMMKGSVQQYVRGSRGPIEDFGIPRELPRAEGVVSLDDVQAVACLDIRIFNTDRHPGNLLVEGNMPYKLICIDHGCVLPAWWALDSATFDAWIDLPHVRAPPSAATRDLVRIAAEKLPQVVQLLHNLDLPLQAIWTLQICTSLLQWGVLEHGLPLRDIALLMTRDVANPSEPCWLERQVAEACHAANVFAEFRPEGKHGDLALNIDKHVQSLFFGPCETTNKRFNEVHRAFFSFLDGAFASNDLLDAVQKNAAAER